MLENLEGTPKQHFTEFKIFSLLKNNKTINTIIYILPLVTSLAILIFCYYNCSIKTTKISTNLNTSSFFPPSAPLNIISRETWHAVPPTQPLDNLPTPVPHVIIHFTATKNCSAPPQCMHYLRIIQKNHMKIRLFSDISFNFLVGGDGQVYEGRGWRKAGAHVKGYNHKSISIAFIGTFNIEKPPLEQISVCKRLITEGVEKGYIDRNYKLFGARQLQTPISPGDALYEEIKTWKHWSTTV